MLPAFDFIADEEIGGTEANIEQQQCVLDEMVESDHVQSKELSSSLQFSVVEFVRRQKKQCPIAADIIRLAKYWYKSLLIEEYVYGAKYCIELIAISVTAEVERARDAEALESLRAVSAENGNVP